MNRSHHNLDVSLFKRLWKYLDFSKTKLSAALLLIICARLIDAWIPISLGWLAQEMLTHEKSSLYFLIESLKLVGLLALGYQLDAISVWIKSEVGSKGVQRLRVDVFSHIQKLKIPFFDKEPVGKLVTRTMHDVDQINQLLSESLLPIFGSLLLFIMIFMAMFYLDLRVALVMLFVIPLILWLTNYFRQIQRKGYDKVRDHIQEMNGFVNENLQGVRTIRHFGLQQQEFEKFDKINDQLCQSYLSTTLNFAVYISGNDFLQSCSLAVIYLVVSFAMHPGQVTGFDAGLYFSFTLYVMMVFRPLLDLAERYNVLQSAFSAAERIFKLLDLEPENSEGLAIEKIKTIEFKDVWFSYLPDVWVLKGVSFKIEEGSSSALVGQTGSGKTTVMSLLLRFYEIEKGEILINGLPIQSYNLFSLRKCYNVILQDPIIFSGTLEENVALFDPEISKQEIQKGLDYVNYTKKGDLKPHSLSSGEKQLISLARATVRKGGFYMLDEATAHIDPLTEKKLHQALDKLLQGHSTLIIAHRLSTIRKADQILVFSHGTIAEKGTHQELMEHKGVYEKLSRLEVS